MAGHKHAAHMKAYADDAAETERPWERWEILGEYDGSRWVDCGHHPRWSPESDYRRKPRTLTIAGKEIQAPLTHASVGHAAYSTSATGDVTTISFSGSAAHSDALANGRLFATPEAAKAAYDAITALLTGKDAA